MNNNDDVDPTSKLEPLIIDNGPNLPLKSVAGDGSFEPALCAKTNSCDVMLLVRKHPKGEIAPTNPPSTLVNSAEGFGGFETCNGGQLLE